MRSGQSAPLSLGQAQSAAQEASTAQGDAADAMTSRISLAFGQGEVPTSSTMGSKPHNDVPFAFFSTVWSLGSNLGPPRGPSTALS